MRLLRVQHVGDRRGARRIFFLRSLAFAMFVVAAFAGGVTALAARELLALQQLNGIRLE